MNKNGQKVTLPRRGADPFWQQIHEHYAGDEEQKWRYLAMLTLREVAGWNIEQIAAAFNHPKGHVTRCLIRVKIELRQCFRKPTAETDRSRNPQCGPEFFQTPPNSGNAKPE